MIEGKRKALIVTISDYQNIPEDKQLPFCQNDGKAMYRNLVKCGYDIPESYALIGKVDGATLRKRIFDFFLRNAEPTDTLLFYFSGHGFPDGHGNHFLVSSDMDPEVPEESGFSFLTLSNVIEKSKAPRKITILDCCYSGAADAKGVTGDVANSGRESMDKVFEEGDGKCVLASSLSDQESFKLQNEDFSAFTYFLIDGIMGGKGKAVNELGCVTPDTLGNYVYQQLMSLPHIKQKPIRKTSQSGEIVLAEHRAYRKRKKELRQNVDSWFLKGIEFLGKNDYNGALANLDKVIQVKPKHAVAWRARGFAFIGLKKYGNAVECFDKSLQFEPADELALRGINYCRHIMWVAGNL